MVVIVNRYNITQLEHCIKPPSKWPVDTRHLEGWMQNIKFNPLGLAELSRIAVRKQAVGIMSQWLSSLKLPSVITRYSYFNITKIFTLIN